VNAKSGRRQIAEDTYAYIFVYRVQTNIFNIFIKKIAQSIAQTKKSPTFIQEIGCIIKKSSIFILKN
jgi:hypothetical protein